MLSQCEHLAQATECRSATDAELIFLLRYRKSYPQRLALYQKIQQIEMSIVEKVYEEILQNHPQVLQSQQRDISNKWKHDVLRTIRYCATAMLLDDPDALKTKFLLWFQTVMKAYQSQYSCQITYSTLQEVVGALLTEEDRTLLLPIVQLATLTLGTNKPAN